MFTKAQVSTPSNFLFITNILLNYYYIRIEPLEWKSQNSNLNGTEFKEKGIDWFLGLAWYKRVFMEIPKPSLRSHLHISRYFCIFYSNCHGQPSPFPLHPSLHNMNVILVWGETHRMRREENSLSRRGSTRGIFSPVIQTCAIHALPVWNWYHICYCCFSCCCFILLVSVLSSIVSSIFSVDDLPGSGLKYLLGLKTILCVLENYPYLKIVLRKWRGKLVGLLPPLFSFIREKTSGKKKILISTPHEFQKGFTYHMKL